MHFPVVTQNSSTIHHGMTPQPKIIPTKEEVEKARSIWSNAQQKLDQQANPTWEQRRKVNELGKAFTYLEERMLEPTLSKKDYENLKACNAGLNGLADVVCRTMEALEGMKIYHAEGCTLDENCQCDKQMLEIKLDEEMKRMGLDIE